MIKTINKMNIFYHPLDEHFRSSNVLPKASEIKQYMSQFQVLNPSCLGSENNIENISKGWIGSLFFNKDMKPEIMHGFKKNMPYILNSINTKNFINLFSEYTKDIFTKTNDDFCSYDIDSFKKGCSIHSFIKIALYNTFYKYKQEQMIAFITELNKQKYIKKLNELALLNEIQLRQKQYPGEQVYALMGKKIKSYINAMYCSNLWNKAILIVSPMMFTQSNGFNYRHLLNEWDSAVFVKSQIKASHSFVFEHIAIRRPRMWQIGWLSACKFNLSIDQLSEKDKVIIPKGLAQFQIE